MKSKQLKQTRISLLISYYLQRTLLWLAIVLSLPLNQVTSLKYTVLIVEDLWLYYYDNRTYKGIINDIFLTITTVEILKFRVFQNAVNVTYVRQFLPVSNYINYTRNKFIEIEDSEQTLIKAAFPYFVYTIPSNIGLCTILYFLFRLLFRYKVSRFIRRFYFMMIALIQILLEGNVSYFVYLCFGNIFMSFNFNFADKLSTTFTVLFLFMLLFFTLNFYFLTGRYLKKKTCYFIYCFYRSFPSYGFLTFKHLIRGFLRGTIHYFLFNFYSYEIVALCTVEAIVVFLTVFLQKKNNIFITKSMFSLYLTYNFLFILLNISLFIERQINLEEIKLIFVDIQNIVIYMLMVHTGLMMIVDLIPFQIMKKKETTNGQVEKQGQDLRQASGQTIPKQIPIKQPLSKQPNMQQQEQKMKSSQLHVIFQRDSQVSLPEIKLQRTIPMELFLR